MAEENPIQTEPIRSEADQAASEAHPAGENESTGQGTMVHPDWKPGITAAEAQPGLVEDIVEREKALAREEGMENPVVEGADSLQAEKDRLASGEPPDVIETPGLGAVNTSLTAPEEDWPPDIRMQAPSGIDLSGLEDLFAELAFPAGKAEVLAKVEAGRIYTVPGPGTGSTGLELHAVISGLPSDRFPSAYGLLAAVRGAFLGEAGLDAGSTDRPELPDPHRT